MSVPRSFVSKIYQVTKIVFCVEKRFKKQKFIDSRKKYIVLKTQIIQKMKTAFVALSTISVAKATTNTPSLRNGSIVMLNTNTSTFDSTSTCAASSGLQLKRAGEDSTADCSSIDGFKGVADMFRGQLKNKFASEDGLSWDIFDFGAASEVDGFENGGFKSVFGESFKFKDGDYSLMFRDVSHWSKKKAADTRYVQFLVVQHGTKGALIPDSKYSKGLTMAFERVLYSFKDNTGVKTKIGEYFIERADEDYSNITAYKQALELRAFNLKESDAGKLVHL